MIPTQVTSSTTYQCLSCTPLPILPLAQAFGRCEAPLNIKLLAIARGIHPQLETLGPVGIFSINKKYFFAPLDGPGPDPAARCYQELATRLVFRLAELYQVAPDVDSLIEQSCGRAGIGMAQPHFSYCRKMGIDFDSATEEWGSNPLPLTGNLVPGAIETSYLKRLESQVSSMFLLYALLWCLALQFS